jgi:hypothetical protein
LRCNLRGWRMPGLKRDNSLRISAPTFSRATASPTSSHCCV